MLGLIFATALMVAAFVEASMATLRYKTQDVNTAAIRPYAYSALEVTLARIHEYTLIRDKVDHILPEWMEPKSEGIDFPEGMEFRVRIEDESSRIGINTLDNKEVWLRLLERYGISSYQSEQLAEAFLDWTDSDDQERPFGAEAETYEREDASFLPPNSAITSIDEIAHIKGFSEIWWNEEGELTPLARDFKNTFSTLNTSAPNLNTASPSVLTFLTDDPIEARSIQTFRNGRDGLPNTADDEVLESEFQLAEAGFNLLEEVSYTSSLLIIEIETLWKGARYTLSAIVSLNAESNESASAGSSTYPFKLLKLSENSRFSRGDALQESNNILVNEL